MDEITTVLNKRKEEEELNTELTRTDIIKCIQSEKVKFRGVNISGLDLSKLVGFCIFRQLSYNHNSTSTPRLHMFALFLHKYKEYNHSFYSLLLSKTSFLFFFL